MTGIEYMETKAYALEKIMEKLISYSMTNLTEEQSKVIYDIALELNRFRSDLSQHKETV